MISHCSYSMGSSTFSVGAIGVSMPYQVLNLIVVYLCDVVGLKLLMFCFFWILQYLLNVYCVSFFERPARKLCSFRGCFFRSANLLLCSAGVQMCWQRGQCASILLSYSFSFSNSLIVSWPSGLIGASWILLIYSLASFLVSSSICSYRSLCLLNCTNVSLEALSYPSQYSLLFFSSRHLILARRSSFSSLKFSLSCLTCSNTPSI